MKLPEPYMTLQGKKRGKLSGEAMPFFTEAQVKQAILETIEAAAKVCESEYDNWDNERPLRICATAIRKLMEGL